MCISAQLGLLCLIELAVWMSRERRVLITGAPGKTASKALEIPVDRRIYVRALVRATDDRSRRLADLGAQIVDVSDLSLQ
jgi:hypothetical protein